MTNFSVFSPLPAPELEPELGTIIHTAIHSSPGYFTCPHLQTLTLPPSLLEVGKSVGVKACLLANKYMSQQS